MKMTSLLKKFVFEKFLKSCRLLSRRGKLLDKGGSVSNGECSSWGRSNI